jgi:hypothetical protein
MQAHTVTIQSGGKIILSGGTIDNGNIIAQSGSELTINNNGKILLGSYDNLDIQLGAIFENMYGEILLKQDEQDTTVLPPKVNEQDTTILPSCELKTAFQRELEYEAVILKEGDFSSFPVRIVGIELGTPYLSIKGGMPTLGRICNFPQYAYDWEVPEGGLPVILRGKAYAFDGYYTGDRIHFDLELLTLKLKETPLFQVKKETLCKTWVLVKKDIGGAAEMLPENDAYPVTLTFLADNKFHGRHDANVYEGTYNIQSGNILLTTTFITDVADIKWYSDYLNNLGSICNVIIGSHEIQLSDENNANIFHFVDIDKFENEYFKLEEWYKN